MFTFLFVDPLNGWALDAQRPKIYRTRDGGATWQMGTTPPLDPTSRLSKIFFWDKMTGWVVGLQGAILKTIDGGETWSVQPIGEKYRSLSGIHFSDQEHGWVVGEYNTILKTSDGGQTWQKVTDDLKDWQPPRLGG